MRNVLYVATFLISSLLFIMPCSAKEITLRVGDYEVVGASVKQINGVTLIPLRVVIEGLGGQVEYNMENSQIAIYKGGMTVMLKLNDCNIIANNSIVQATVPPQIINGLTYVPVRVVAENLNCTVDWKPDSKILYVWNGTINNEQINTSEINAPNYSYENNVITQPNYSYENNAITQQEYSLALNKLNSASRQLNMELTNLRNQYNSIKSQYDADLSSLARQKNSEEKKISEWEFQQMKRAQSLAVQNGTVNSASGQAMINDARSKANQQLNSLLNNYERAVKQVKDKLNDLNRSYSEDKYKYDRAIEEINSLIRQVNNRTISRIDIDWILNEL